MDEESYLASVTKGKLSVAEALKEIESVKQAFQKAERIEQKIQFHDSALQELKSSISTLTSFEYVNMKFEELSARLEKTIKKNFEEFISQYIFQLNEKVSHKDYESGLSQRVTWVAFNNFSQQMNSMKSRVEKHIMSDFEGFKTKVKLELSKKANEKKPEEEYSYEEIHQLKNRVTSLEQKVHDMFADEGLDESEDYDSQEEMDNIMDDVDKTANRDRGDSDENHEEEDDQILAIKQDIPATPTTQNTDPLKVFTSSSISPENLTQEEEKKEETRPENSEIINKVASPPVPVSIPPPVIETAPQPAPSSNPVLSTPQEPFKSLPASSVPEPQNEVPNNNDLTKDLEPKPVSVLTSQDSGEKAKAIPKIVIPNQPVSVQDDSAKTPTRAKIEMESLEPQAKYSRGKPSSRADNQTLSRKNSMVSSRSGTNAAGGPANMRNINKKITALQKELETYKQALDDSKQTLLEYQEEIAKAYDRISQVRGECKEVEERRQAMEQSFIKALRRNGIERKMKTKAVEISNINAKQMSEIKKQIEEKGKKITTVSSYVEKMAADTQAIKENQKNKINDVVQYLRFLDESRQQMSKEFSAMAEQLKNMENDMKGNIFGLKNQVETIQGPIIDLISEQKRENHILSEDIKSQQNLIYEFIETKKSTPRSRAVRFDSTGPDLSLKYKFASSKQGNRRTSAKTGENWLESIPDGNPLVLPRIVGTSPIRSKKL